MNDLRNFERLHVFRSSLSSQITLSLLLIIRVRLNLDGGGSSSGPGLRTRAAPAIGNAQEMGTPKILERHRVKYGKAMTSNLGAHIIPDGAEAGGQWDGERSESPRQAGNALSPCISAALPQQRASKQHSCFCSRCELFFYERSSIGSTVGC